MTEQPDDPRKPKLRAPGFFEAYGTLEGLFLKGVPIGDPDPEGQWQFAIGPGQTLTIGEATFVVYPEATKILWGKPMRPSLPISLDPSDAPQMLRWAQFLFLHERNAGWSTWSPEKAREVWEYHYPDGPTTQAASERLGIACSAARDLAAFLAWDLEQRS